MDYSNERWIRVYTRDTVTWKLLTWQARAVLLMALRKADRAGVIDVGTDGIAGLAAVIEMPEDVVTDALVQLERRGVIVSTGSAYVVPNFLDAQETPSSDKQRAREARDRRRAAAIGLGTSVTKRDDTVTKRDDTVTKRDDTVTRRHAASRGVTPSDPIHPIHPIRSEPEGEGGHLPGKPGHPTLALVGLEPSPRPDLVADLWAEQERLRAESVPNCRPLTLTADRRARITSLRKAGHTDADLLACLAACAAEARGNGGEWFNGDTNWRPDNVARTLGRIGTAPARASPAVGRATPATIHGTGTTDPRTITPRRP